MDLLPMLSTGLVNVLPPPAALVSSWRELLAPRRGPFTMVTVNDSATLSVGTLPWGGKLTKGIEVILPPTGTFRSLSVFLKRNWKVMSSTASPLLSR